MASWLLSVLCAVVTSVQADCTIVYFGTAACQPCEQIKPTLQQLQQEGWDIRAVDTSTQQAIANQYRIENLPTVVIVSNGREVDRVVGVASYEQLLNRFNRVAARNRSSHTPENRPTPEKPTIRGQSGLGGMLASSAAAGVAAVSSAGFTRSTAELASTSMQSGTGTISPATISLEQAIARSEAATVRIRVEEANTLAFGTGTIVDVRGNEALVLTCGHLFRDMKAGSQLTVDLFAGTPREMNVIAQLIDFKSEGEDVGLISFQLPVAIEPVPLLPRGESLQVGQAAYSFGCDHGESPTRRDTRIKSINRYVGAANVEIAGAPAVGRSGGGLFDTQGRLIGVCNAADSTDDEGIYAAAEVFYAQIQRLGLEELFEPSAASSPVQPASHQPQSAAIPPQATPSFAADSYSDSRTFAGAMELTPSRPVASPSPASESTDANEIIVIVRDAAGGSRIVTIAQPTRELMDSIEQHSVSMR